MNSSSQSEVVAAHVLSAGLSPEPSTSLGLLTSLSADAFANPRIRRGLVERGLQRRTVLPGDIGVTCEPRQPVTESSRNQVRRRARNSNAHLRCGAPPGRMPNAALALKISLDREHCSSYHHGRGRRGSGSRKAFPAQNPPTRQADEWANRSSPDSRLVLIGLPTFRPSAFAPPTQRRGK
ncbi:MAG: hypothetical protein QOD10_187 [Mycobacterium sp.]|nr:hypothetical protein [Mycobacterium sp.]